MRHLILALFIILPGIAGIVIFGYYALVDWDALQKAFSAYSAVDPSGADLRTLFAAEAQQNIHRINLFADGVWTLLSAILAAIGLVGLFLMR